MNDLYREEILDHYRAPHNFGSLSNPTVSWNGENVSCGDKINMEAIVKDDVIRDIVFSGESCAISTASASLLTDFVKGKKVRDVMKLETQHVLDLLRITLTPTRLKCALLPLEVLQKMIRKVQ